MNLLKAIFSVNSGKRSIVASLKQFLETRCQKIQSEDQEEQEKSGEVFLEELTTLLESENIEIRQLTLRWLFDNFIRCNQLPSSLQGAIFNLIRPLNDSSLIHPLIEWLELSDSPWKKEIPGWLAELDYSSSEERAPAVEALLNHYLCSKDYEPSIVESLKHLDAEDGGAVTNLVLSAFPTNTSESNQRIIHLLGQIGRYRVVKPLIIFSHEFSEYLRAVMKALSKLNYDEVDQFYIDCLGKDPESNSMVLIEAIRQVRKRRLRRAIPILDELFPMEESPSLLVNRAINGEIALTMASFGVYLWGREKLLDEILLSGINQKYLKAIEMLNLEEAVPLLKTIMLMPETPKIAILQEQAYRVCEKLLASQKRL